MKTEIKLKKHYLPGKLIVFEGTDGAGKTTMLGMLYEFFCQRMGKERVIMTKQPTDMSRNTKLFQKMMYCKDHDDIDYRAVQLLTMSDRIQHTSEIIIPALSKGGIVLCDRYIYTSLANMLARGYLKEEWFFEAAQNLIMPDAVLLAYVEPDLAIQRIKSRPEECRRHLNESLLYSVAETFLKIARKNAFSIIDTAQAPESAFAEVIKVLRMRKIID